MRARGTGRARCFRPPAPVDVPGSEFVIPADQIVKAIGQKKPELAAARTRDDKGYIQVNDDLETSMPGVFAGGDCIRAKGAASTVMAVQDGKLAAMAIHSKSSSERKWLI